MIFLSENLKALRSAKSLTQQGIADDLGLKKTAYSNYENKVSSPNFEILKRIADYHGITVDSLLYIQYPNFTTDKNKILVHPNVNPTVNPIPSKPPISGKTERIKELQALADEVKETFGKTGAYNVHDFDGYAAAGQAIALLEEDKKRREPNMYLPGLGPGLHVRVTAAGESMFPSIKPGDKAVSTWLPDLKEFHPGEVYLVIDVNDGAVYKRLYKEGKTHVRLESDNEMFRPYTRHLEDILAVFRVREVHTTDLRPFWADIRRDVAKLKAEMEDVRCLLQQK